MEETADLAETLGAERRRARREVLSVVLKWGGGNLVDPDGSRRSWKQREPLSGDQSHDPTEVGS